MDIVEKLRRAAAPDGWCFANQELLDEAAAEIELLRKGIRDYLNGDYEPRIRKTERCEHEVYGYEVCEACTDAYFTKLLNPPPGPRRD